MDCTVGDKHVKANRRTRSVKSDSDHPHLHPTNTNNPISFPELLIDSSASRFHYMGYKEPLQISSPVNNDNSSLAALPHNHQHHYHPDSDDDEWGYCTEQQLEEILLKRLEYVYHAVISKLVKLDYKEDVALEAVLCNGQYYGGMDIFNNVLNNSLGYLQGSAYDQNVAISGESSEMVCTDLRQLGEYSLSEMVSLLQQTRPHLSKGDAMWCLVMSELHLGRASSFEIPMLPPPCNNGGSNNLGNRVDDGNCSITGYYDGGPLGSYKFHAGWGSGHGSNPELPDNGLSGFFQYGEATLKNEVDCPQLNLTPDMTSLLTNNVAGSAGFRANSELQMQDQDSTTSSVGDVPVAVGPQDDSLIKQSENPHDLMSQDMVSSLLNKFRDLNLNEVLDSVGEDDMDAMLFTLLHKVKDLERQVKDRKEWAQEKAIQAARKLSADLTELKILRMEREETQPFKKGKQTLEDTTMKRLSEMESALRKASSQVDLANATVRQLEVENAEIRAEMEASKLSASESVRTCLVAEKREKKFLKKLAAWEKQKTKLQEEISVKKQKISDLRQQLVMINSAQKEAEAKWKQEVKAKELAAGQVDKERHAKEAAEMSNKRNLETQRSKIDIDFQRHKDDLQRLEQELSQLKSTLPSAVQTNPSDSFLSGNTEITRNRGATAPLLHHLDELDNASDKEASSDRECILCMKEEVTVVFLPCAHQVICASCDEDYGRKGKAFCPCCRVAIEQRIRIFGASS